MGLATITKDSAMVDNVYEHTSNTKYLSDDKEQGHTDLKLKKVNYE